MVKKSLVMVVRVLWNGGVARVAIEEQKKFLEMGIKSTLYFLKDVGSSYILPQNTIVLNAHSDRSNILGKIFTSLTGLFAGHRGKGATVDVDYIFSIVPNLITNNYILFHDQWSALSGIVLKVFGKRYGILFHEFFRRPPGMSFKSPLNILALFYDLMSIKLASYVIVTSEYNYKIVHKFNKHTILARIGFPTPIPLTAIENKFINKKKRIISISMWEKGRKPDFYADLAKALPNMDFILAGSWAIAEEESEFRAKYSSLANLQITGKISEEQRSDLLRKSHFYIRLGYNERGPGMGGLEAMSYGVIPIANRQLGINEIIESSRTGFIIDEPFLNSAVSILNDLNSRDPDELKEISKNCLYICEKYSWKDNAEKIWSTIQKYS